MTIAVQLKDIRESIYQWLSQEIRWSPGDTRLGDVIYGKYWLRVQSLRMSLSEKGFSEQAGDVREHWVAAVAELNSDSLYDLLNTTYQSKSVSPYNACWDCWPENGPEQVERFLHSLGGFLYQFNAPPPPCRYSLPRDPQGWMKMIEPGVKSGSDANKKAWQRLKKRNLQHMRQNADKKRQWSMSEKLVNELKLRLDEFAEPANVD